MYGSPNPVKNGVKENCTKEGRFYENPFLFDVFELCCEEFKIENGNDTNLEPALTNQEAHNKAAEVSQTMKDVEEKELENEETIAKVTLPFFFNQKLSGFSANFPARNCFWKRTGKKQGLTDPSASLYTPETVYLSVSFTP